MIKHIYIINFSHYDIGFTDYPSVCREAQVGYLDEAIDFVCDNQKREKDRMLYWTVESNNALYEWWQKASPSRRRRFLDTVKNGWIEICAMPFNNNSMMNELQWEFAANWLPEELWRAVRPKVIMQNDVNGIPRAGVMKLMDRGAEFLWMAINPDTGGSPFNQPSAFWWEMPDKRKIFVWNSITYPAGYFLFEKEEWRKGPLPRIGDTRYRPPTNADFFETSEENLNKAQRTCVSKIKNWEKEGYDFDKVLISMTNMWRVDNDPPCYLLPDFIARWNKAGIRPTLSMTTPSTALKEIRKMPGTKLPVYRGEWTDWWVNGVVSAPAELSAGRKAKRNIEALGSELFGKSKRAKETINECLRQLCMFDEHTFGSSDSIAVPDGIDSRAQFGEKSRLAYQPWAKSGAVLGEEIRKLIPTKKGVYVVNPYRAPYTGWVTLTDDCLRGKYAGVVDTKTLKESRFVASAGQKSFFLIPTKKEQFSPVDSAKVFPDNIEGAELKLWVEDISPNEIRQYNLVKETSCNTEYDCPEITIDSHGWPSKISWKGKTLFDSVVGDFLSLEIKGGFPRWNYKKILDGKSEKQRRVMRDRMSEIIQAEPQTKTSIKDTGPTVIYEQYLKHPRMKFLRRRLEVYKNFPMVKLKISVYRISKPESAEVFYVRFPLNAKGYVQKVTNGGMEFEPGKEQIPNTCKDYFAIDGKVIYRKKNQNIVLNCLDSAVVSLGGINDGLRINSLSGDLSTVYSMIYNNVWYTNFAGDESGLLEYEYDIYRVDLESEGFAPLAIAAVVV